MRASHESVLEYVKIKFNPHVEPVYEIINREQKLRSGKLVRINHEIYMICKIYKRHNDLFVLTLLGIRNLLFYCCGTEKEIILIETKKK